jgi:hypothetical protein
MEDIAGLDMLAAYVFFFGMANSIFSFVDAAIISFKYPRLVYAARHGDRAGFQNLMRSLRWQVILATLLFSVFVLIVAHALLLWLDRPIYTEEIQFFYWLLAAMGLFGISMIPHMGLYACGQDRSIVTAHILSLIVFVGGVALMKSQLASTAIPIGLVLAFLFLWLFKEARYRQTHFMKSAIFNK